MRGTSENTDLALKQTALSQVLNPPANLKYQCYLIPIMIFIHGQIYNHYFILFF